MSKGRQLWRAFLRHGPPSLVFVSAYAVAGFWTGEPPHWPSVWATMIGVLFSSFWSQCNDAAGKLAAARLEKEGGA